MKIERYTLHWVSGQHDSKGGIERTNGLRLSESIGLVRTVNHLPRMVDKVGTVLLEIDWKECSSKIRITRDPSHLQAFGPSEDLPG